MTLLQFISETKNNYIASSLQKSKQSLALISLYFQSVLFLEFNLEVLKLQSKSDPVIGAIVRLSETHYGIVTEIQNDFIRVLEQNYNGQGQGLGCNAIRVNDYFFESIPEQLYQIQGYYNI